VPVGGGAVGEPAVIAHAVDGRRRAGEHRLVAQESFEREWHRTAVDLFPEWKDAQENFEVALDLVHFVMDGLAVSFPTHDRGEQDKRLLAYLETQIHELSRGRSRPG
jgi:hypothetical protein